MIMDIQAVLNEYDGFYARNNPEGAYAFIRGKIAEAREAGAWQHELTMLNEVKHPKACFRNTGSEVHCPDQP